MYEYLSANYNILVGVSCCNLLLFKLKPKGFHLKAGLLKRILFLVPCALVLFSPFVHTEKIYTAVTIDTFNASDAAGREMSSSSCSPRQFCRVVVPTRSDLAPAAAKFLWTS